MYYIGLMSGTSADAIDAVILEVSADGRPRRLLASHQEPLPAELRAAIHQFASPSNNELERMGAASVRLGRLFARAAQAVLDRSKIARSDIRAIGSHGQTIRHKPAGSEPYTLQIGEPAVIVEQTGITTVSNFRARDLAAGGEGAPLVPAFHEAAFRSSTATRAIVNIGGIANVTFLAADPGTPVTGFDVGPGNVLLDQWIHKHRRQPFDHHGDWARSGRADPDLMQRFLADPYFSRRPPKSTGREYFHLEWLAVALGAGSSIAPEDVQATLAQLTVETVANALTQHDPRPQEVYLCGGGAKNAFLVDAFAARLAPIPVGLADALGFPAQWVEAAAFAWLAHQTLEGRPGNIPSVTGARHPAVLGAIYKA
jgi:anhydro-N-acetylmuramic acid kinase